MAPHWIEDSPSCWEELQRPPRPFHVRSYLQLVTGEIQLPLPIQLSGEGKSMTYDQAELIFSLPPVVFEGTNSAGEKKELRALISE